MKQLSMLFLLILSTNNIIAQESAKYSPFIVLMSGIYSPTYEQFDNIGSNKIGFTPQFLIGLPLSSKITLHLKYSYYEKNQFKSTFSRIIQSGSEKIVFSNVGSANYNQQYLNVGLGYEFQILNQTYLNIIGGIANSRIRLNQRYLPTWPEGFNKGLIGYYLGLSIEEKINSFPLSLIVQAEYSSLTDNSSSPKGKYGGIGIVGGIKYEIFN